MDYTLYETLMKNLPSRGRSKEARMLGQTSKLPYSLRYDTMIEICDTDINKQEFFRYISQPINHTMAIMTLMEDEGISASLQILKQQIMRKSIEYRKVQEYEASAINNFYGIVESKIVDRFTRRGVMFHTFYKQPRINTVLYDVVTLYNILTNRGSCTSVIQNYSKDYVLRYFNNNINYFLDPTRVNDSILVLNVYLYGNAVALNIHDRYKVLVEPLFADPNNSYIYHEFVQNTEDLRIQLIAEIRDIIINDF